MPNANGMQHVIIVWTNDYIIRIRMPTSNKEQQKQAKE